MSHEHCTGAQLAFDAGSLMLDFRKGGGHFAFTDDVLEPVREYDEDGVWDGFLVKMPASELEAVRDFLNKWLPPTGTEAPSQSGRQADAAMSVHDEQLPPTDRRGEVERLREVLEPFARAYERWADGGNLTGWQAQRMKMSVDAHRFARAAEVYAALSPKLSEGEGA